MLFQNVRETFAPSNINKNPKVENTFEDLKPQNIDIADPDQDFKLVYVSMNISLFKCKPTTLNMPGQFLITFTPPVIVFNYLFSDLQLLKGQDEVVIGHAESKGCFVLDGFKFDDLEYGKGSKELVKWRFFDQKQEYYMSQSGAPFFMPSKPNKGNNQL